MADFAGVVDAWATESADRMERIWKASTQRVHAAVVENLSGGVVDVQTGFLRASDQASTDAMPPIVKGSRPSPGASYSQDFGQISTVISSAQLGMTIHIGWVAEYGPYLEFGTDHISPRGFVRLAAVQWPQFVSETVAEAKSRAS